VTLGYFLGLRAEEGRRFNAAKNTETPGKGGSRFYKNIGLGFKTPKEAIEGGPAENALNPRVAARTYIDKKCPLTSDVSIRGRILSGRSSLRLP